MFAEGNIQYFASTGIAGIVEDSCLDALNIFSLLLIGRNVIHCTLPYWDKKNYHTAQFAMKFN